MTPDNFNDDVDVAQGELSVHNNLCVRLQEQLPPIHLARLSQLRGNVMRAQLSSVITEILDIQWHAIKLVC